MRKQINIVLLSLLLCAPSWAQVTNITLSPKLSEFLADHPLAKKTLTNAFSETFLKRSVGLYYFYSYSDAQAKAFHYYPDSPGWPEVVLCIQENQSPIDEFITLLFETINTKSQERFRKLGDDAARGAISKESFVSQVLRNEFEAIKSTRELLLELKFKKEKVEGSAYYRSFTECPTNYDDYISYSKKLSQARSSSKEYESIYDSLRKGYLDSSSATNSASPKN